MFEGSLSNLVISNSLNTMSTQATSHAISDHGQDTGLLLPNGCRITHGSGANIKTPFPDMNLTMHELSPSSPIPFSGQLGFIEFDVSIRLPRHIHMSLSKDQVIAERILVLNGVGLVELAGEYYAVAPGSLVDAKGGVPHTWTACPAGVRLPDGTVSQGWFTMVYLYEDTTTFFPTDSTRIISRPKDYQPFLGQDFEPIRIPVLSAEEVIQLATVVIGKERLKVEAL